MLALSDRKVIINKEKLTLHKILSANNNFIILSFIDVIICFIYSIFFLKKPKIIFRHRGTDPDESFERHKSKFRWLILCLIEFLALLVSNKVIVVSNDFRELICKRYGNFLRKKIFVLPNLIWKNKIIRKNILRDKKKIVFCYVGGMSTWQHIDLVVYSIEYLVNNFLSKGYKCKIQIRTASKNNPYFLSKFNKLVYKYQSLLDIKEIEPEKLVKSLDNNAFGFIVRDNSIINKVASPFKIRDYLTAGIRIIATGSIGIINQFPSLIKEGNIYLIDFNEFKLNKDLYLNQVAMWIEEKRKENFNYSIVEDKLLFEKLISDFNEFIEK